MIAEIAFRIEFIGSRAAETQRAGFVLLAAFLLSFLFIRTSARMIRAQVSWWPGNVETSGGLHIHHLVWGICLLMITGIIAFATNLQSPWWEVLAALFGVGMGLTLDEFALWLRLEDVYWSAEGRQSIDAVVIAFLFAGLLVVGLSPFDVEGATSHTTLVGTILLILGLCVIAILKGKLATGLIGVFLTPVALVGAIRLAKPNSPWAHRRYSGKPEKLARATARQAKREARLTRARNLIGGTPSPSG